MMDGVYYGFLLSIVHLEGRLIDTLNNEHVKAIHAHTIEFGAPMNTCTMWIIAFTRPVLKHGSFRRRSIHIIYV